MKSTAKACFICGHHSFENATSHYERCLSCGHETLINPAENENIANERLDQHDLDRPTMLDRFKNRVLSKSARSKAFLLDVGSASGRFLYQNREDFEHTLGIEVTPECVNFARALGLHIETDLASLSMPISVSTFWHSLEHIPADVIESMLGKIRDCSTGETSVIVSVPNADSLQYALLKEHYAFYDVPHHLHQFTPGSVNMLMSKFGFEPVGHHFSFAYASFGWLQGLLNLFNDQHDYLYYRRKRGLDFSLPPSRRRMLDLYNVMMAFLLLLPSLMLTGYDYLLMRRGGTLTVCYQKKTH